MAQTSNLTADALRQGVEHMRASLHDTKFRPKVLGGRVQVTLTFAGGFTAVVDLPASDSALPTTDQIRDNETAQNIMLGVGKQLVNVAQKSPSVQDAAITARFYSEWLACLAAQLESVEGMVPC